MPPLPELHSSLVPPSPLRTGEEVGIAEGIAAGFTAGEISQAAKDRADEAYLAAHDILGRSASGRRCHFRKIAAGAVGALAIKADAIDGKVINGVEVNGAIVTGSRLQTGKTGARTVLRPGASSIGYGKRSPGDVVWGRGRSGTPPKSTQSWMAVEQIRTAPSTSCHPARPDFPTGRSFSCFPARRTRAQWPTSPGMR